jgi:hypothetical protein
LTSVYSDAFPESECVLNVRRKGGLLQPNADSSCAVCAMFALVILFFIFTVWNAFRRIEGAPVAISASRRSNTRSRGSIEHFVYVLMKGLFLSIISRRHYGAS